MCYLPQLLRAFQSLTLPLARSSPIGLAVNATGAAYRHILRDGEPVLGQLPELQVALLRELQVTQAAPQVSCLLPQLPVGLLQLLLTQQDGVHFLLPQGLMLPASHRRTDTVAQSASHKQQGGIHSINQHRVTQLKAR